jgi:transglutaminase-like putative cysteine protease
MSAVYRITHRTRYKYREPVTFGEHRMLFRPRESHDLRVLATDLKVAPAATIRLILDAHSNSIALVQPLAAASELELLSSFTIEQAPSNEALPIAQSARNFPFAYSDDERVDLEHYLRPHHDDPKGILASWARQFLDAGGQTSTEAMLLSMNQHIKHNFRYQVRHEEGTQDPLTTLQLGTGTCRDFAFLMMEALRQLGVAARFVSGYLYDPALDGSGQAMIGSGSTHAWLQAYLPGAGWVAFDPTNNLLGGSQLIRVAITRHPRQAAPVSGSWFGRPGAYLGMEVEVKIARRRENPAPPPASSPAPAPAPPLRAESPLAAP